MQACNELENRISEIEDFKEAFESSMDESTTYDDYLDYQAKLEELQDLYARWDDMAGSRT